MWVKVCSSMSHQWYQKKKGRKVDEVDATGICDVLHAFSPLDNTGSHDADSLLASVTVSKSIGL